MSDASAGASSRPAASPRSSQPIWQLVRTRWRSRSRRAALSPAEQFAAEHGIDRAHASWQALAADPDVDVVYVATPHIAHHAAAKLMLEAGKAVLCEKPFTLTGRAGARI